MKYYAAIFLGIFVFAFAFTGCFRENALRATITGSGNLTNQERHAEQFTGVNVSGSAKVIITQNANPGVRVEADDNIISEVTTTFTNGALNIGMKGNSYSKITVNVYVTMPEVKELTCSGSAQFITSSPINTDELLCKVSGTGDFRISGTAENQVIEVSGTGNFRNKDLNSKNCSVTISGTGNADVTVTDNLTARIAGVGNINYYGNPKSVSKEVLGVGNITGH